MGNRTAINASAVVAVLVVLHAHHPTTVILRLPVTWPTSSLDLSIGQPKKKH